MTARVWYFSEELNDWIRRSQHKNRDMAIVNAQVCAQRGCAVRVIEEGKLVFEIPARDADEKKSKENP